MWSGTLAFCAGLVASRKEAGAFWHSPSLAPAWGSSGARAVQVSSMFAMGPQQMLGTQNSIQNFMSSVGAEIITTGAAGAVAEGATVGSRPFDAVLKHDALKVGEFGPIFPLGKLRSTTFEKFKFTDMSETLRTVIKKRSESLGPIVQAAAGSQVSDLDFAPLSLGLSGSHTACGQVMHTTEGLVTTGVQLADSHPFHKQMSGSECCALTAAAATFSSMDLSFDTALWHAHTDQTNVHSGQLVVQDLQQNFDANAHRLLHQPERVNEPASISPVYGSNLVMVQPLKAVGTTVWQPNISCVASMNHATLVAPSPWELFTFGFIFGILQPSTTGHLASGSMATCSLQGEASEATHFDIDHNVYMAPEGTQGFVESLKDCSLNASRGLIHGVYRLASCLYDGAFDRWLWRFSTVLLLYVLAVLIYALHRVALEQVHEEYKQIIPKPKKEMKRSHRSAKRNARVRKFKRISERFGRLSENERRELAAMRLADADMARRTVFGEYAFVGEWFNLTTGWPKCKRQGCPCVTHDGLADGFCCRTCRDSHACPHAVHTTPSSFGQPAHGLQTRPARSTRNLGSSTPVPTTEQQTQTPAMGQPVTPTYETLGVPVSPSSEDSDEATGGWVRCACRCQCKLLVWCMSWATPALQRCSACRSGPDGQDCNCDVADCCDIRCLPCDAEVTQDHTTLPPDLEPAPVMHARAQHRAEGAAIRASTLATLLSLLTTFTWIGPAGATQMGWYLTPSYTSATSFLSQVADVSYLFIFYAIPSYLLARLIELAVEWYARGRTPTVEDPMTVERHSRRRPPAADDPNRVVRTRIMVDNDGIYRVYRVLANGDTEVDAEMDSDHASDHESLATTDYFTSASSGEHEAQERADEQERASNFSPSSTPHHSDSTPSDGDDGPRIILQDGDGPPARSREPEPGAGDESREGWFGRRQRLNRSPARRRLSARSWDELVNEGLAPNLSAGYMDHYHGVDVNDPFTRAFHDNPAALQIQESCRRGHYRVGYALAFMLKFICLFTFIVEGEAVTCSTCYDQIPGCTGGENCLLHTTPVANLAIVTGAAGVITLRNLLPLKFLRECTRSVLDCLKMVANRPPMGTPIDLTATAMNVDQLITAVQSGRAAPGEAVRETMSRVGTATTQIELARLNALSNLLQNMEKAGGTSAGVTSRGGNALGSYSLVWALAGKITRQSLSVGISGITEGTSAEASSPAVQVIKLVITRPVSMVEFSDMLTIWMMICHATGLGNILVLGEFLRDVVYDTMLKHNHSWQIAHELFLVYLEAVETSSDDAVNIRTIFTNGSQDTYLKRAMDSASVEFKGAPKGGDRERANATPEGEVKWNGNFNRKATTSCFSYNMGTPHPTRSLDDKGTCKHNHVCDHWVSNKGPRGTCGGKHPRSRCDNPNKCDAMVTK